METHNSHGGGKLTRTPSSLLRSPTIRSSFQSLSAVDEDSSSSPSSPKPKQPAKSKPKTFRSKSNPNNPFHHRGGSGSHPLFPLLLPLPFLLLLFLVISYLRDESSFLGNLVLACFLMVLASVIVKKSQSLLSKRRRVSSVQWFIGDGEAGGVTTPRKDKATGKCVREGVEFYSNGDCYEGEFHRGRCNGSGVYNFFGKGKYEGDWVDGKYDGFGIESWARGSRYRGQYRQGLRHGFGVYRFYSGDSYAGEWVSGQSHGIGVQSCSDGSSYYGEFKCGVKHGLGVYHFRNGDQYCGEYFGDKIHGFGVYSFANGHCYEGSWHDGKKQGFGLYTFRNADLRSGHWDSGALKNPVPPSDPNIQRAVLASRKAMENAIRIQRVEEQVNKAVTSANRAATAARVAAIKAVQNRIDGKFCDTDD
ncbi:hypothetical protein LUZ60_002758 [Juncus effusus]|nr:hypothetical protein LUZ60_002758 [Juncus effusus]